MKFKATPKRLRPKVSEQGLANGVCFTGCEVESGKQPAVALDVFPSLLLHDIKSALSLLIPGNSKHVLSKILNSIRSVANELDRRRFHDGSLTPKGQGDSNIPKTSRRNSKP